MKIQVIIFLVIVAVVAAQKTSYYCGRHLSRALATLCENDHIVKGEKRSGYDNTNEVGNMMPWIAERKALALFTGRGKRQEQMVVSECCDKPCAIEELMTYCST